MKMHKKGVVENLSALGIGLAGVLLTFAIVFLLMANVGSNTQVAADANATAAVNTITSATATIPGWVPLVIVVAIGGLILYMVKRFGR